MLPKQGNETLPQASNTIYFKIFRDELPRTSYNLHVVAGISNITDNKEFTRKFSLQLSKSCKKLALQLWIRLSTGKLVCRFRSFRGIDQFCSFECIICSPHQIYLASTMTFPHRSGVSLSACSASCFGVHVCDRMRQQTRKIGVAFHFFALRFQIFSKQC